MNELKTVLYPELSYKIMGAAMDVHNHLGPGWNELINYLKFWKKNLGILINFGLDRLQYERLPFTPQTSILKCTGTYNEFSTEDFGKTETIKTVFSEILDQHGLGYGTNVYKKLFQSECLFQKIHINHPSISLSYKSVPLGRKEVELKYVTP